MPDTWTNLQSWTYECTFTSESSQLEDSYCRGLTVSEFLITVEHQWYLSATTTMNVNNIHLSVTEAPFSHGVDPLQALYPPPSPLHSLLSTFLCPLRGSSESCWENPLGRILVEQKLLMSSLILSHGATVKFSKVAQGWESSWCWVMPSGKSIRTWRKMTGWNSLEVVLKYASVPPALTVVTTATHGSKKSPSLCSLPL